MEDVLFPLGNGTEEEQQAQREAAKKKTQLRDKYRKRKAVMDALIDLWNIVIDPMESKHRPSHLPPPRGAIVQRAKALGLFSKIYRTAFFRAYGSTAMYPYTHMTKHLEEMQPVL